MSSLKRPRLFVVALLIVVAGGTALAQLEDREAYAVYSSVARHFENSGGGNPKTIRFAIQNTTILKRSGTDRPIAQCFSKKYSAAFNKAFADYTEQNTRQWTLSERFRLPFYDLVPADESVHLSVVDYWKTFYAKHPGAPGLLQFSAVGFDPTRTKAVVTVQFSCGGLCATDTDFLLEKHGSAWQMLRAQSSCGGVS